jgi:hypothetical protein
VSAVRGAVRVTQDSLQPERSERSEWAVGYAPAGRILRGWRAVIRPILHFCRSGNRRWCVARTLCRSLRGHIQARLAIEHEPVDLGPAYLGDCSGRLQPNISLYARTLGIQSLSAKYPWASLVDSQIFLLGFDEGEKLSHDTSLSSKWAETYKPSPNQISAFLQATKRGRPDPLPLRE